MYRIALSIISGPAILYLIGYVFNFGYSVYTKVPISVLSLSTIDLLVNGLQVVIIPVAIFFLIIVYVEFLGAKPAQWLFRKRNRSLYISSIILTITFQISHYVASGSSMFAFMDAITPYAFFDASRPKDNILVLILGLSWIVSIALLVQTEFASTYVTREAIHKNLKTKFLYTQSKHPKIFRIITVNSFSALAIIRITVIPVFVFITINLGLSAFFLGQAFYKYRPFHYTAISNENMKYITKSNGYFVFSFCEEGTFTGSVVLKQIHREKLIATNDTC